MNRALRSTVYGALIGVTLSSGTSIASDTVVYTGSGRSSGHESTLTLANGLVVAMAKSDGVAAISTQPPSVFDTRCVGLGLIQQQSGYASEFYCTFRQDREHAFDLRGRENSGKASVEILGGSGRFKDASGSGSIEYLSHDQDVSEYRFEFTLTTP